MMVIKVKISILCIYHSVSNNNLTKMIKLQFKIIKILIDDK